MTGLSKVVKTDLINQTHPQPQGLSDYLPSDKISESGVNPDGVKPVNSKASASDYLCAPFIHLCYCR